MNLQVAAEGSSTVEAVQKLYEALLEDEAAINLTDASDFPLLTDLTEAYNIIQFSKTFCGLRL